MKILIKITFASLLFIISSCDLYPDWKNYVEYSDVFPVCGEYYVQDYDISTNAVVTQWYQLYIYNKSFNPTKDSIWIDNRTGHPSGISDYPYKFKIKCKTDTVNLTFDVTKAGDVIGTNINPLDSAVTVTIKNSKIWRLAKDIEDPTPDSIYFEFTYYNKYGIEVITLKVAGHRKTGWEFPEFNDNM